MNTKQIAAGLLALAMALPFPALTPAADSYVESLKVDPNKLVIETEDLDFVDVKVKVKGDASKEFTYTSSNESIAMVTETEIDEDEPDVVCLTVESFEDLGTATITITTVGKDKNGKQLSEKIEVEVLESVPDEPEDADLEFLEAEVDPREDGEWPEDDGSSTTISTENGVQTKVNVRQEDNGNTVKTTTVVDANGGFSVSVETSGLDGTVLSTTTSTRKIEESGNVIEEVLVKRADGTYDKATLVTDKDGFIVEYITESGAVAENTSVVRAYNILSSDGISPVVREGALQRKLIGADYDDWFAEYKSGEASDGVINIPSEIKLFTGATLPVNGLAANSITGRKAVLGTNVNHIATNAFANSGTKSIVIKGSVTKQMFEKNSLKGAGKKKGKGLTITVLNKKDKKTLNKVAKKAGVPKVKIVHRNLNK